MDAERYASMAKLWLTYAWKDNQDQDVDHVVGELKRVGLDVAFDRAHIYPRPEALVSNRQGHF
jgi:hypothetical protein